MRYADSRARARRRLLIAGCAAAVVGAGALVAPAALDALPRPEPVDPVAWGLAERIGAGPALVDSLGTLTPDELSPLDVAALEATARLSETPAAVELGEGPVVLHPDVVPFYHARGLRPAWRDPAVRDTMLHLLAHADRDGLDPAAFRPDALRELAAAAVYALPDGAEPAPSAEAADLDLLLTDAYFRYADALLGRRADPAEVHGALWEGARRTGDPASLLDDALAWLAPAEAVPQALDALHPPHGGYHALRRVLAETLDGARPDTVATALLALNLERWRWLPDTLGALHVFANIPEYRISLRERDASGLLGGAHGTPGQAGGATREVFGMRTVVGRRGRWRTPVFSDTMETVVFNPTWTVPASIQMEQYGRVQRGGMVQPPGPRNPMGRVKFLFPNKHAVYIHDTNAKAGFRRDARALSHGCLRAGDPEGFARAVLSRTNGVDSTEIGGHFRGRWTPRTVEVGATLPVHVVYFTAWVDADGELRTADDIYGYDAPLAAALGLDE